MSDTGSLIKTHSHDNMEVIQEFSDTNGELYYKNAPVFGVSKEESNAIIKKDDGIFVPDFQPHIVKSLNSEAGIHDLRYWNSKLQHRGTDGVWADIATGSSGESVNIYNVLREENILFQGKLEIPVTTDRTLVAIVQELPSIDYDAFVIEFVTPSHCTLTLEKRFFDYSNEGYYNDFWATEKIYHDNFNDFIDLSIGIVAKESEIWQVDGYKDKTPQDMFTVQYIRGTYNTSIYLYKVTGIKYIAKDDESAQICSYGQISTTSDCTSATLDYNPFEYEYLVVDVTTEQGEGTVVNRTIIGMSSYIGGSNASVVLNCHDNGKLYCEMNTSSIQATSYDGDFCNIFVDIKGYRSSLFKRIITQNQ